MKNVFSKLDVPKAPGGDRYEWSDAKTDFNIQKTGLHVIKIAAKAKNAKQNKSTDDDDLRIALDGFHFGKYEKRKDKISWKGFGTSSAWDGASLKGGTKTIYYFVELDEGGHNVQFFADGTPEIENFEVFEIENLHFELNDIAPKENIVSNKKGIPWLSFVFLGTNQKSLSLKVKTESAKENGGNDGDNLKVVVNGKPLQNPWTVDSKKYQNFYFSGDMPPIDQLYLDSNGISDPMAFENSIELWYDQKPKIESLSINFFDVQGFLEEFKDFNFSEKVKDIAGWAIRLFKFIRSPYSAKFLQHALNPNPSTLIFKANHPIVAKIKADPAYQKIIEKLSAKLKKGQLEGEIWPKVQINFDSWDLATAIHGIKKIEYKALKVKSNQFAVKFKIFDVYDFQKNDLPYFFYHPIAYLEKGVVNALNFGEEIDIINSFEIQININQILWIQ